ncbi:hypothetical protein [Desulfovibrio ferrophilus]|uniref:Type IV pilus assembly PilZ n=1 Tax=Desulfovibrio ferrophilus TaxID=241368 RepID=A0A2Z6AWC2_9BACT|nr:hypothetical protein [Desulfovibrio ferrophilus]BBD07528.1 type IV pilus assembly PilZ [Desulfovibrio ferrophilus]
MTDDKRTTKRLAIQAVDFATLLVNDTYMLYGSITNVCQCGLNMELFPSSPGASPLPGDAIQLRSCPKGLNCLIGGASGTIAWVQSNICGIQLNKPVAKTIQELEQHFYARNLAPWSGQGV